MSRSKATIMGLIVVAFLLTSYSPAIAETMKFRAACFHKRAEIIEVGDVEGHIMGVGEAPALASFENGEVAAAKVNWFADYIKGEGMTQAYTRLTFEDGATIDYKYLVTTRLDPSGKGSLFKSQSLEILRGTGRFAGIKGEGTLTGKRIAPLGAGARVYLDIILTYSLP